MYELAEIQKYRVTEDGTDLIIRIPKDIGYVITDKHIKSAEVRFDDGRSISGEQRKKAYATIRDIADFLGYLPEEMKELMKYEHIIRTGCQYFSLSTCTMDTAREFINTILEFALENDIPLSDLATNRTDDIGRYLYFCIKNQKCAVCGKGGEIHHCEGSRVGMGNNRAKIDNSKRELICLCREHHTILHSMSEERFMNMHKVYGIKVENL